MPEMRVRKATLILEDADGQRVTAVMTGPMLWDGTIERDQELEVLRPLDRPEVSEPFRLTAEITRIERVDITVT